MREDEQGEGGGERVQARGKSEGGTGWWAGGMIARNSSPGRCGAEGIIQTLPLLSPLSHLSKSVCESPRVRRAGPRRGQWKTPRLHSPTCRERAHHRHLTSHWSLLSAGGEEERGVSFSEPQKYYTFPFIILSNFLSVPPPFVVSLHSIMLV